MEKKNIIIILTDKAKKKLKVPGTMDLILWFLIVALVVFVIDMRNVYVQTGGVPGELIACVFGAATGEFGFMGWIQTSKNRKQERKYELEDRAYSERKKEEKNNDI